VGELTAQEVIDGLERTGAPYGLVQTLHEAVAHPFFAEREAVAWVEDPLDGRLGVLRPPFRFSRSAAGPGGAAPLAGEHTEEILRTVLSLGQDEVTDLQRDGVVAVQRRPGGN
jgi:crotonobetainyl-CoA:carnitine CoA-transferase CaiB-like acyl-CoA transferase